MAAHYRVELGQAIKRRREELGLTQKDLAELTHYKEAQTVSRWERGENLPSDLEIVARALQWSLSEMVAGIEPPDRKTARKFGFKGSVELDESQLDRIERKLNEIHALLSGQETTPPALPAPEGALGRSLSNGQPSETGHRRTPRRRAAARN